jgi:hypothetical protein
VKLKPKILILILLSLGSISTLATSNPLAHAAVPPARLEVWSPDLHSSNITSLTAFPVGSVFTVKVNLTSSARLGGFDISLDYNITEGPNVLQATGASLAGGLFDPNNPPTGCFIFVAEHEVDIPPGQIRFAAVVAGGCSVPGTGTLFSVSFQVTGVGATSIDIVQYQQGIPRSQVVDSNSALVNYQPVDAYFQDKPGIPPVASFSFSPQLPLSNQTVTFDATSSYDSDNPTGAGHGIQPESVVYDTNGDGSYNAGIDTTIFGPTPVDGTSLGYGQTCYNGTCRPAHNRDPNLLFNDTNHNGVWDPGEPVIYDTDNSLTYTPGDVLVSGPTPALGTALSTDPKIQYVDLHTNSIWDNGYVWNFGDGTAIVPGNVTVHIFMTATVPASGTFPVKLVVYDIDDGLPTRQIILVKVSRIVNDIALGLSFSNVLLTIGDTLQIQVALANRGTLDEHANLNVTYDFQGSTTIAREVGLVLPLAALRIFNYTLSTSGLALGTYTVTAQAVIVNATTGATVPDPSPSDNTASESFVLLAPPPAGGHASLVKWRSLPEFHHEVLSRNPIQTLLAASANNGNQTIDSYVQFRVTGDAGVGFFISTPRVTLSPGQEIDSRLDSSFTASFYPIPGAYTVTATIYYNAITGSFKFTPDISSQRTYSFTAS